MSFLKRNNEFTSITDSWVRTLGPIVIWRIVPFILSNENVCSDKNNINNFGVLSLFRYNIAPKALIL